MAMLPNGAFDANTVEPSQDFDPVPAGEYIAMITDSGMKATKDNTGQYLEITLQIQDGQYKGRLIWDRLNLVNKSQQASDIAQRTLSSICRAVGVMNVTDSMQLHNKPMKIRTSYKEQEGYRPKNEVAAYKPATPQAVAAASTQTQAQQQPAAAAAAPAQTDADTPPWAGGAA